MCCTRQGSTIWLGGIVSEKWCKSHEEEEEEVVVVVCLAIMTGAELNACLSLSAPSCGILSSWKHHHGTGLYFCQLPWPLAPGRFARTGTEDICGIPVGFCRGFSSKSFCKLCLADSVPSSGSALLGLKNFSTEDGLQSRMAGHPLVQHGEHCNATQVLIALV